MFYSKSTSGFYTQDVHGDAMPSDVVAVTAEQHAALLAGQAAGQVIKGDSEGLPVLAACVAPTMTPAQQLSKLDSDFTLTQRNLREFILLATEALKLGQAIDLSVLPGVAKVAEVEAAAALLRAQL